MRKAVVTMVAGVVAFTASAFGQEAKKDMSEWRFPVGLSYISGFADVVSYYEDHGYGESSGYIPIGLSFAPYYQFDHGSRLGFDLGPAAMIIGDATYWDVPVGVSFGFNFMPHASVSPYARFGVRYHIAGGDDVDSSTPGLFGGFGVEFLRTKMVGVQAEIGYDSSEVSFGSDNWFHSDKEKITTGGVTVSVRAVF